MKNTDKFINCGCNYKGLSYIKDRKHCGMYVTYCKQCGCDLSQVNNPLRSVKLYNTKGQAELARKLIFCEPEKQLLNSLIPGLYQEDINETLKKIYEQNKILLLEKF